MTGSEVESKRRKAVEFLRRIRKDEDAERFEATSPEDYAPHKGAELLENPTRRFLMARKTVEDYRADIADLKDQIAELQEENEALSDQLDAIQDILEPEEEEEEEGEEDSPQPGDADRHGARKPTSSQIGLSRIAPLAARLRARDFVLSVAPLGAWRSVTSTAMRRIPPRRT